MTWPLDFVGNLITKTNKRQLKQSIQTLPPILQPFTVTKVAQVTTTVASFLGIVTVGEEPDWFRVGRSATPFLPFNAAAAALMSG